MAKRGSFMGLTGQYGGYTSHWATILTRCGASYFRCGYPEITDMLSAPSHPTNPGTFTTTTLESEVANCHADGIGYCFTMLGTPKSVNSSGPGHYIPTNSSGDIVMAIYAGIIAHKLMDSFRSTGVPVYFEVWNEPNIGAFNAGSANAARVAAFTKTIIDTVRTAEPLLPIIGPSIANRGDINNSGDADVIARWDGPHFIADMLSAEPTLKTTSAPDYWGYHPYVADSDPQSLSVGWGMQQMYNFAAVLAFAGAKSPGGGMPQTCVTEYGARHQRVLSSVSGTSNGSPAITTSDGFLDGDGSALGEEGAAIAGTNIPASTTILTVDSGTTATMSQNATGTVSGVTITRETFAAEQVWRYTQAFNTFRTAGWVSGPEFMMGKTDTDSEHLVAWDNSEVAYGNGSMFEFVTQIELGPGIPDPPVTGTRDTDLDYVIEIGIPPLIEGRFTTDTWVLDDATRGHIDSGYVIGEPWVYREITGDVQEITISRGGPERDRTDVGTCSVIVRNDRTDHGTEGDYSTYSPFSPFAGFLGPRSRIRISCNGKRLWTGDITDVPLTEEHPNVVYTTFNSVDTLGYLNKTIRYTPEAVHTAGKRISRILERAKVPERGDGQYLFTGVNTYQSGTPQKGPALQMCADVAFSEGGMFYANPDGVYVFIDWAHMNEAPPLMTWTDDPTGELRYSRITRDNGFANMINAVEITGIESDSTTQYAHNDIQAGIYGPLLEEYTLPIASEIGRQYRANQIIDSFAYPQPKVTSIEIPTARYTKAQRISYIFQEVGHVIEVSRDAPGEGRLFGNYIITGINHRISNGGRSFTTEFLLTSQL